MAKITSLSFVVPVKDVEKAVRFYCDAFNLEEVFRGENIVFVGMPGTDTAVGILQNTDDGGQRPSVRRLPRRPRDQSSMTPSATWRAPAGTILERGEHAPGVPFARIADPDGNVLWI